MCVRMYVFMSMRLAVWAHAFTYEYIKLTSYIKYVFAMNLRRKKRGGVYFVGVCVIVPVVLVNNETQLLLFTFAA